MDIYKLQVNGKIIISNYTNAPKVDIIWSILSKLLVLVDEVEVSSINNLKCKIKVYKVK